MVKKDRYPALVDIYNTMNKDGSTFKFKFEGASVIALG
jgi:hypothetical protein